MSYRRRGPITGLSSVLPGTQLNGIYDIDRLIAAGGMGEVYLGHNIQTGDPVAIKIVLPEFAAERDDPRTLQEGGAHPAPPRP